MYSMLNNEMELFTLSELQTMMEGQHENVYSLLMTKKNLQEKYTDEIIFVIRSGKSDFNSTPTEAWYSKRKVSKTDEAECHQSDLTMFCINVSLQLVMTRLVKVCVAFRFGINL